MSQKFWLRMLVIVLLVMIPAAVNPTPVIADIAVDPPPVGSDLAPNASTTNVRMVSETVTLDIIGNASYPYGKAVVKARFNMRNLSDTTEQMNVRFPLRYFEYLYSFDQCAVAMPYPSIENFSAEVNGQPANTSMISETLELTNALDDITYSCWAEFPVTFPPQQDISISVSYVVTGYSGGDTLDDIKFFYVLVTGAGWKDTIGSADIIARFPYELNDMNYYGCNSTCSGNTIQWHFENFEPSKNIEFEIVSPYIWFSILKETENTRQNPTDGEAWGG
jgi:hypothetical protein